MEFETSGHSRWMCSLRLLRAKLRNEASGSERKPTRPAADVRPTVAMGAGGERNRRRRLVDKDENRRNERKKERIKVDQRGE
jgi:hypothetical protein